MPPPHALPDVLPLSRHLARLCDARPDLAGEIEDGFRRPVTSGELKGWLAAETLTEDTLKPSLRRLKQRAGARIAARDLAGAATLAEVTEGMTLIAETAVTTAVRVLTGALAARYGTPRNEAGEAQQLIVVGMGKLGGRELNVSSDIDLIFVYPEDGETDGPKRISNFEFFTRLGRALIAAISEVTSDGYVFRVDMRLRPDGDSGPLAASFEMLENYFVTQGREWERYAWIKARPLTGGKLDELEAIRRPFVFRKYLDFGTIDAMRDLHAQIRREVARKDMADNVKLGPGGIREIEFIAQVFQLIRGGRDRALQARPTLAVLSLLVERRQISLDAGVELAAAYDFLRRLEHRLQYLDDAQTHRLPEKPEDRDLVARAMNFGSFGAMLAELDDHRQNVSNHFEAIFAARDTADAINDEPDHPRLSELREGARYRQMSESARTLFESLIPGVLRIAARTGNADACATRCLDLLESIARRPTYLVLLREYPLALEKVVHMAASSSWAADYLKRHPVLLDELLDPRLLEDAVDLSPFMEQLRQSLDDVEPDIERQMDLMREAHHAQVFRLLAQDIAGLLTVERLSDHLSDLADLMVGFALDYSWRKLPARHMERPRFAVIAYGKLGGKELGYASDLDLVFIFDDDHPEAAKIYSRLATRLNTWLSAQTSAGQLFETDLRLRPNGDAGLVVTSLEAFRKYQIEAAWAWEHQAITRARFCAGDPAIGAAFEDIRREVLRLRRDPAKLREEVLAMRRKMYDAHAGKSAHLRESFDLKQDPGGLIDVEFIVQFLVLGHSWEYPELTGNKGNIALLKFAADRGLIPSDLAEAVRNAYRDCRRMQHALRLNSQNSHVDPASVASQVAAVQKLWNHVFTKD
ncbi:MAG: bifunctional [glutamate--ammonia ligase]-adenylyl-L-tyrosine phosphorylase/[glutamate--ammonia-ligase] adenylyltransferase [Candidatus Nitricoxidivorans perseverans]|uniref:Bifunctional glutamine synthetase adenylyltransferase/adenylyl-removing enzyme n=1 Tax=Candidatus Nitricoxidivorans perseverans TaxID=2975601 RepID=A0AA49IW97_9PROT|nr:MAG: bifunctional [glutamate--ammonia ligase]-adenylyl-L-tyrosine phosphorylase/[glutamate--ammonia-ligase] adenylyltransferase [Candidatus Nitricoxidivorans perseverans]